jgi:N-acetylglucosamine malate deacetylase 1
MNLVTQNSKVLVVMAHPDDAELICFGTILKLVQAGATVTLVVASPGMKGVSILMDDDIERANLYCRWQETSAAFSNTGVDLRFLNFDDGNLSFNIDLITQIEQSFELQPDIVITHYIDKTGMEHQDHTAVGMATLNVARRSKSTKLILQPHPYTVGSYLNGFDVFVDITDLFELKLSALQKHVSQQHKPYFSEQYHRFLCQYHSLSAGYDYLNQGRLFERFTCPKLIVSSVPSSPVFESGAIV